MRWGGETRRNHLSPHTHSWLLQTWDKATCPSFPITSPTFPPAQVLYKSKRVHWSAKHNDDLSLCVSTCHISCLQCLCASLCTYLKAWYRCPPHLWSQRSRPFLQSQRKVGREKRRKSQLVTHKKTDKRERVDNKLTYKTPLWCNKLQTAFKLQLGGYLPQQKPKVPFSISKCFCITWIFKEKLQLQPSLL